MSQNIRNKEFINVTELAEIMGISRAYAYEYVKTPDCPFTCLQMGKRIIIPTNDFFRWYDSLQQVSTKQTNIETESQFVDELQPMETVENILS